MYPTLTVFLLECILQESTQCYNTLEKSIFKNINGDVVAVLEDGVCEYKNNTYNISENMCTKLFNAVDIDFTYSKYQLEEWQNESESEH